MPGKGFLQPRVMEYVNQYDTPEISLFDTLYHQQFRDPIIVQSLAIVPAIFDLTATVSGESLLLNWLPIPGAVGYNIYGADQPDVLPGILLGTTTETSYTVTPTADRHFFWVTSTQR